MIGHIFAILSGIILGATLGMLIVVKSVRKRIASSSDGILDDELKGEFKGKIQGYVKECESTTEINLRKKLKKNNPILIVKLFRKIKGRIETKRLYNKEHTPPDELPPREVESEPVEDKTWYPFYLLLHSIGTLYQGDRPLSFLELNEKDVFGIIKKVSSALTRLFDGIGIERLKRIKCSFILDTINLVKTVLHPLSNDNVKAVYKTSMQGIKEFNKIRHAVSLNPFYHLRLFVRKKITNELVIEAVKCAIDVVAIEIVNIYSERQSNL